MKAIIPVAGAGTKLRPHTHTQPKPLIPVAGKPILGHIIENLLSAGINQQVFIIGYLREKIRDYVETQYGDTIQAEFVVQEPRKGLAHAMSMAIPNMEREDTILVVLGDTIFSSEAIQEVVTSKGATLAVQEVDNPRDFGIATMGPKGLIKALKEKPQIPVSNLALVGLYKITHVQELISILEAMISVPLKDQEEYLLTDALMHMIQKQIPFRTLEVEDWFDCGKKQSLLEANRILLERIPDLPHQDFRNAVIKPPVYISSTCKIENSIIGPYVAIGEHTILSNSIVSNSILGSYSELDSIILNASVIGNDTILKGKSTSISIGDNTEIDFKE